MAAATLNEAVDEPWPGTTGAVPASVDPFKNCTVPVGDPLPGAFTVIVAVTDWRFDEELITVVVEALWTVSVRLLVEPRKLTSPLYVADTLSAPAGKEELVNRATLPLRATGPPSGEPFKTNETEPVAPAEAVAISVTACPYTAGIGAAERVRVLGTWQERV